MIGAVGMLVGRTRWSGSPGARRLRRLGHRLLRVAERVQRLAALARHHGPAVPHAGPVGRPGLVAGGRERGARRGRAGRRRRCAPGGGWPGRRHWAAGLAGGAIVILSWTIDAGRLIDGGLPGPYPWPIFAAGMLLALAAAVDVLRGARGSGRRLTGQRPRWSPRRRRGPPRRPPPAGRGPGRPSPSHGSRAPGPARASSASTNGSSRRPRIRAPAAARLAQADDERAEHGAALSRSGLSSPPRIRASIAESRSRSAATAARRPRRPAPR